MNPSAPPDEHKLVPPPPEPEEEIPAFRLWHALGLSMNGRNLPDENEDNVVRVLSRADALRGRFWYDTFHHRMMTTWRVPAGEAARPLSDADVSALTIWFQRRLELRRLKSKTVDEALRVVGWEHARSEPVDWMRSLAWDGVPRLETMLSTYFRAPDTEYTRAAATNWLTSMVARVMRPGCQVQTMVVLEAGQGRGKSRGLRALGGAWFAEATESVQSKDFVIGLQGKLLVEIGEMDAFRGADITRIKQVISNDNDYYRGPYERRASDHPRQCVFVGTTNDDAYLHDHTGGRRFWPVQVGTVDVDALAEDRAQLFAEAVRRYDGGYAWWVMPREETIREQESRRQQDEWETLIREYVEYDPDNGGARRWQPLGSLTVARVLKQVVKLPEGQWGQREQQRVARCLKAMGWTRKQVTGGARVYLNPDVEVEA